MSYTYDELRSQVGVDIHNLEEECSIHGELLAEVGATASTKLAEAKAAKHNLDTTKGRIHVAYRSGQVDPGIKVTETSVSALVDSHKDVVSAKAALIETEKESGKWQGLLSAFEHRRSMLNNEVDLWVTSYQNTGDIKGSGKRRDVTENLEKRILERRKTDGQGSTASD